MQDYYIYKTIFLIFMFIIGAAFGSFLCCQARRLRIKEKGNTKKLNLGSRSVCLDCGHKLRWYDNIPIVSWLVLGGKCRNCKKKIGIAELLSELGLALAFLSLGANFDLENITPFSLAIFVMTQLFLITLGFLSIYDGLYGELPSLYLTISVICAIIIATLRQWEVFPITGFSFENLLPIIFSVLVLAGTYLILYLISKGKWVGDGDWILALAIALVLGSPWLALNTLFIANFIACIVMLPILKHGKKSKKVTGTKIYLGPFLVIAFVIVFSFQNFFMSFLK